MEPTGAGSALHVTARCWWFTRIFTAVWYALLTPITLGFLLSLLTEGFTWELLVVPGMWAWGFFLPHFCFWRPMDQAKRDLCRILHGQIETGVGAGE